MMAAMPKPITRPSWISSAGVGDHLGVVLKREAHGRKLLLQVRHDCSDASTVKISDDVHVSRNSLTVNDRRRLRDPDLGNIAQLEMAAAWPIDEQRLHSRHAASRGRRSKTMTSKTF